MNTCKLSLFTWAYVQADNGERVLSPICPTHPDSGVYVNPNGPDKLLVTCTVGGEHMVNACPRTDFDAERQQASQILGRY